MLRKGKRMRLTFTIEFTRDEPETGEPCREVDMGAQVELGPPSIGFAHPEHENPYEDRTRR